MSLSGLPFDDIRDLIAQLHEPDERAVRQAHNRNLDLATRFGPKQKQHQLTEWLAAFSGKSPIVSRPMMALFAGAHKIAEHDLVADTETTLEIVTRLAAGGAPVNQVCSVNDIGLKVFDLALQFPVENIASSEALDEKGAAATIGFGMEAIAGGVDVLGLAAFGQGSEIANTVLLSLLLGIEVQEFAEDLLGQTDKKIELAEAAKTLHLNSVNDPLELLRRLGGREHSAIAGAILAARINHIPVVVEGWTALIVVNLLQRLEKSSCDHCCFASKFSGSRNIYNVAVEATGLQCILGNIGVSDDGSGAAMAIGLLKSISAIHTGTVFDA